MITHDRISVHEIIDRMDAGAICVPEYQRLFAWSREKSEDLIDSLHRGLPIPSILFYEKDGKWFIEDGQCRLKTIYSYITGISPERWNHDGTAPSLQQVQPDDKAVAHKGSTFSTLDRNVKRTLWQYKLSYTVYSTTDDDTRALVFTRLNDGKSLQTGDLLWASCHTKHISDAQEYFFGNLKRLPWGSTMTRNTPKQNRQHLTNAVALFFTAAFHNQLWPSIDTDAHTAKTKCLTTFYAILRIPLEKKTDYDLEKTHTVLDIMVGQLRFIKSEINTMNVRVHSWIPLFKPGHISGFVLTNILLDPDDPNKLTVNDLTRLVDFCKKQSDKYNPLQRLSKIFRREEHYVRIPRSMNDLHFRWKHSQWIDGLRNAKMILDD